MIAASKRQFANNEVTERVCLEGVMAFLFLTLLHTFFVT